MVLVLDCMKDDMLAESFDRAISRPIREAGEKADFLRLAKTRDIPGLSQYSHFIISGSEASVVQNNPWEDQLKEIIDTVIDKKKSLLGICYGHQFLARALQGISFVRRSQTPEFGWLDIPLARNPLFEGIKAPVFMVSHYDEVCPLNDDFKILAATPRCPVHAFQYKDLPVWGLQFHPEYNVEEANVIFELIEKKDPSFSAYFFDTRKDETQIEQNERIFLNFLAFRIPGAINIPRLHRR